MHLFVEMSLRFSEPQFPDGAHLIRGYDTWVDFNLTVTNTERYLRIDEALPGTVNFNVSVVTARPATQSGSRKRRAVSADPSTETEQRVDVTRDQLMQLLDYGAEITLTGQVSSTTRVVTRRHFHVTISHTLTIIPYSRLPSL